MNKDTIKAKIKQNEKRIDLLLQKKKRETCSFVKKCINSDIAKYNSENNRLIQSL